jgi:ABC-2 type transport system ATP-binding protein
LLILDEPTAGVDISTRARMIDTIRELAAEEGCAVCYSTHYLGEVEDLRASVAILDQGQIIARGGIAELVREHSRSAVELLFDDSPPALDLSGRPGWDAEAAGRTLRIYCDEPSNAAAEVMGSLEAHAGLRSVSFVTPSLEAVFLGLTGRRWEADDDPAASPASPALPASPAASASAAGAKAALAKGGRR